MTGSFKRGHGRDHQDSHRHSQHSQQSESAPVLERSPAQSVERAPGSEPANYDHGPGKGLRRRTL